MLINNREEEYEPKKIRLFVNYIGLEYYVDYNKEEKSQELKIPKYDVHKRLTSN